jgi:seryl-tRNA synthetase
LIDVKLLRDKPDEIKKMLQDRNVNFELSELIRIDSERRSTITELESLKMKKNIISKDISEKKRKNEEISPKLEEMQSVAKEIDNLNLKKIKIQELYDNKLQSIPNIIHNTVPRGIDSNSNLEIMKWNPKNGINKNLKDHIEISLKNDLIDIERAAKISGSRFYFLKNELVKLNYALISFALKFMNMKGYKMIQPPYLMNRKSMSGAVILSDFEEVIYKIEDQDLYLIGTSEHAAAAMHSGEIFSIEELPLRYISVSPCFRKEAGSHGRDTKGIFRVHQFEKVEIFSITDPEESWNEHENILMDVTEFYEKLEIPYRVMLLSSGDMGKVAAKTYDIEAWLPGQNNYREIVSCSNCTDYQSRRLGIKFRYKQHENSMLAHTLNSTVTATERTLIAIIENFQNQDGSITIPKVLRPYMDNQNEIKPSHV